MVGVFVTHEIKFDFTLKVAKLWLIFGFTTVNALE